MPYSGPEDDRLPDHVKKMPAKKRRQWVGVWNSAYARCKDDGGATDKCEGKAFRQANGVVSESMMIPGHVFFSELEAATLVNGKPIDVVAPGEFVDMYGRPVKVKPEELPAYIENTQEALEATRTESGELVGLPIDAEDHDKGDGAGWIVGVSLEQGIIRAMVRWTEVGKELIEKSIRRYFSPTLDIARKVLMGGSLTNWPASRDKESGVMLLRPVELKGHPTRLHYLASDDESLDEQSMRVRQAFSNAFQMGGAPMYVLEVFPDHAVVETNEGIFKVPYTETEGEINFAAYQEWSAVRRAWIEAAMRRILGAFQRLGHPEDIVPADTPGGETTMTMKPPTPASPISVDLSKLAPEQRRDLAAALFTHLFEAKEDDPALTELARKMDSVIEARATKLVERKLGEIERDRHIREFVAGVVGGTEAVPKGLPVTAEELEAFLAKVPDDLRPEAQRILALIVEKGLTSFAEVGHARKLNRKQALPVEYANKLRTGALKLAQLSDPMIAADLGDLAGYDLAEFEEKA